jgi:hypothetical protein
MSFFNKLKARNELNNNILSSTNPPTTNDTNTIFQKAGSNELNNSLENNKPINDMNNILNISAPIISNNNNNVPNNTNPNIQQAEILQENINKFKKYIEFINNDQHYFINYNTSYEKAKLILDLQNKYSFQELKNNIKLQLSKYKQSKVYSFKTEPENIVVYDTKKKYNSS